MRATLFNPVLLVLLISTLTACNIMQDEGAEKLKAQEAAAKADQEAEAAAIAEAANPKEETEEIAPMIVNPMEFNTERIVKTKKLKGFAFAPGTGYEKPDAFVLYANGSIAKKVVFQKGKQRSVVITGNAVLAKKIGPKVRVVFDGKELAMLDFNKKNEAKEVAIPGEKLVGLLVLEFTNDYFDESKHQDRNMEFVSVDVISK